MVGGNTFNAFLSGISNVKRLVTKVAVVMTADKYWRLDLFNNTLW